MESQVLALISAKKLASGMFKDARYYRENGYPDEYLGYTEERELAVKKAKTPDEVYAIMEAARRAS